MVSIEALPLSELIFLTAVSSFLLSFIRHFIINRLTPGQRLVIVQFYNLNNGAVFRRHKRPAESANRTTALELNNWN